MSFVQWVLLASTLLLLSVITSKASGKLGIPALLLFLGIGMAVGATSLSPRGADLAQLAQSLGIVALVLGVFAGGLETDWNSVRPVLRRGLTLSTAGVLLTALLTGAFVHLAFGFSPLEGLVLGAIVSSTDASTVFGLLRTDKLQLRGHLRPLLELEAGSNDPMAFFLTTSAIYLLTHPQASALAIIPSFGVQMSLGAALGLLIGRGAVWLINHLRLEHDGLYPVLSLALVLLTYSATAIVGGNGFLAVYVAGVLMGNSDFLHKRTLVRFHDGLAWLMQIAMFLTLGLLVVPSRVMGGWGSGLLLVLFLAAVARPISVFVCLLGSGLQWRDKALVAWVGLRGATPIILATFPLLAGVEWSTRIFDLVFFVVTISLLLKSMLLPGVATWLGVTVPPTPRRRYPLEFVRTSGVKSDLMELPVPHDSAAIGHAIVELGLPKGTLVVLLGRGTEFLIPSGSTILEQGDSLLVLADRESLRETRRILHLRLPAQDAAIPGQPS
jgi:cell volume regulation protein A